MKNSLLLPSGAILISIGLFACNLNEKHTEKQKTDEAETQNKQA